MTRIMIMTMIKDTNNRYVIQKPCVSQHIIRN